MEDYLRGFGSGALAACVSKSTFHPLERSKMLIRTQLPNVTPKYPQVSAMRGLMEQFKHIIKYEGVSAIWRGNVANLFRYAPTQALNVGAYYHLEQHGASPMIAGATAGVTTLVLMYPVEMYRMNAAKYYRRMGGGQQKPSLIEFLRSQNISGVYRGFGVSGAAISLYRSMWFALGRRGADSPMASNFLWSFAGTSVANFVAYPVDTVRRRSLIYNREKQKLGVIRLVRTMIKQEGFSTFWQGASAGIAGPRILPGALMMVLLNKFL